MLLFIWLFTLTASGTQQLLQRNSCHAQAPHVIPLNITFFIVTSYHFTSYRLFTVAPPTIILIMDIQEVNSGKGTQLVLVNHFAVSSGRIQCEKKKFCLLQSISKVVNIKCHTFYMKTSWVPHNKVAICTPGGIDLKLALQIIGIVCRELRCFWRE